MGVYFVDEFPTLLLLYKVVDNGYFRTVQVGLAFFTVLAAGHLQCCDLPVDDTDRSGIIYTGCYVSKKWIRALLPVGSFADSA